MVVGCVAIYPILWGGAVASGLHGAPLTALGVALTLGATGIYGLFHVLDGRRDPGALIGWARWSQLAYAFSLWTGLLLLLRAPVVLWAGGGWAALCWPGLGLVAPLGLAAWGATWTYAMDGVVRSFDLGIPGLEGEIRLVHLSDLHVGPTMRRAELDRLFARVRDLRPDLVLITGDLLMPYSEQEHTFLLDALPSLGAPTFCCPGNHDLPVLQTFQEELARIGCPMLVDEARTVEIRGQIVEILGVNFHWARAKDRLTEALAALPPAPGARVRVLMAHDPRLFRWVPPERVDLVLSGHTHGGQVGTDMFGLPWSVLRPLGVFDQGFWRRGRALLYVHRGNWTTGLPPRMGIAGEIVVHRLGATGDVAARAVREAG